MFAWLAISHQNTHKKYYNKITNNKIKLLAHHKHFNFIAVSTQSINRATEKYKS